MKTILLVLFIIASAITPLLAQVGINTEDPRASLDVNGDLKIRNVPIDNTSTAVLVLGADSVVHKNTTLLLATAPQSFAASTGSTSVSLLSLGIALPDNWNKIQFPNEEFDEHNDYNVTTSEFLVPKTGIYNLYVQFETTGALAGSEIGVGIFRKPVGSSNYTLLAEETFFSLNVSVLVVDLDVSPPTRKTQRLVKLTQGDVIIFGAKAPVSATLIGGSKSFFTINQVK